MNDIDRYFAEQRRQGALDLLRCRRNTRILAERLHWPAGALQECERLSDQYPAWDVVWLNGNPARGFERPAGFRAKRIAYPFDWFIDPDPGMVEKLLY